MDSSLGAGGHTRGASSPAGPSRPVIDAFDGYVFLATRYLNLSHSFLWRFLSKDLDGSNGLAKNLYLVARS